MLVDTYERRLYRGIEKIDIIEKDTQQQQQQEISKKKAKPDDLVHVYDNLIQNMEELCDLKVDDAEQSKLNISRLLSFKAMRCFYVALSYLYASRWSEAIALFDKSAERMDTTLEHYKTCKNVPADIMTRLQEIESKIRGHKAEAKAKGFLESIKSKESPIKAEISKSSNRSLLQGLNEFDSSFAMKKTINCISSRF